MTGIEKKTAAITGAAGGIGQAISRQFVANGFRVVGGDADQADLDKLEAELNRTGQIVWSKAGDLREKSYCEELIEYSVQATVTSARSKVWRPTLGILHIPPRKRAFTGSQQQ
ncbi:SDR family NAD(P)-dependent oxidoreductase [Mesorhizobium sp. L103C131B0]|uniref:SDR family NAD(P)-dependent oxidoreductase n=1 Tax=Mesorhizobium sp. L103C131B0 TaxID=1287089 RepID=UPI0003D00ECE|nr:SDR family NAD(P)-dependent oxidoreductase [Mesorhizobium sp. L103C131B0]ESZ53439.1 hypothetical protein X729_31935 [Mesorhizobium sp. L103C131B0]